MVSSQSVSPVVGTNAFDLSLSLSLESFVSVSGLFVEFVEQHCLTLWNGCLLLTCFQESGRQVRLCSPFLFDLFNGQWPQVPGKVSEKGADCSRRLPDIDTLFPIHWTGLAANLVV